MARIKHYNATTQKWEYSDISSAVKGETGATGATGATPNLTIGTVSTLPAGSNATAEIVGNDEKNPILNLGIPRGANGEATGAVMYTTSQSLTDAQKTQARNNINAAGLASPALTGTPTAPTAAKGTNTTQIATTAFVQTAVSEATAGISPKVFQVAASTASNLNTNLFLIDTADSNILKYYNGTSWTPVTVGWG